MKNSEAESFEILLKEIGITMYDFMDLYSEFSDLSSETRMQIIEEYHKTITGQNNDYLNPKKEGVSL